MKKLEIVESPQNLESKIVNLKNLFHFVTKQLNSCLRYIYRFVHVFLAYSGKHRVFQKNCLICVASGVELYTPLPCS